VNAVYIYALPGERHALVRGNVGGWFRDRRIPALRTNLHSGWWLRQERVPDVMASLSISGYATRYAERRAPAYVPSLTWTEGAA